jgi:hypothetical protein
MRIHFCFLAAIAILGCGDDADSSKAEDGDIPEPRHFSELKQPFNDAAGCTSTMAKKHQDTSGVTSCRCNACLDSMEECEAVPGCIEIMTCSNQTGCLDEFSCYLLPGAKCAPVIDQWGNSSLATAIALDIMACSKTASCR